MKIKKIWLSEFTPTSGLIVVIDVIRAFTTAAHAFHKGAREIIPVLQVEDAFTIKKKYPEALLMGEIKGDIIEGFHFGNSPLQFEGHNIHNAAIIQRTTCGTQGVVRALKAADHILAGSFVIAKATLKRILNIAPDQVTLLMTSIVQGDEDAALADYLEQLLLSKNPDPQPYLERVKKRQEFSCSLLPDDQMDAITSLDRFAFAIELFKENSIPRLKPVDPSGKIWT